MIKQSNGILRIGTSGIVVPGNKLSFPAAFQHKSRLNYYSSLFNTLEINSTFYKVPMQSTFEKWSLDVPEQFQFTIKLWREITHVKKRVFPYIHLVHHKSSVPTPFDFLTFHPVEAIIHGMTYFLLIIIIPIHPIMF